MTTIKLYWSLGRLISFTSNNCRKSIYFFFLGNVDYRFMKIQLAHYHIMPKHPNHPTSFPQVDYESCFNIMLINYLQQNKHNIAYITKEHQEQDHQVQVSLFISHTLKLS